MSLDADIVAGPYRGLTPFGDTDLDALLFFGREREREIVVANLIASRLTVLYGPSGVGKSSLLRAGVARTLRGLPERPVVVIFSRWAEAPSTALADAVWAESGSPGAGDIAEALDAADDRDVYLILDQAEEYFLYHAEGAGSFEQELARLVTAPLRCNLLISIREDALASLDRFKGRIPNVFANSLRLDRLDREAGQAAILRPVARWNDLEGTHVDVEPELVIAVLAEVDAGRVEHGLSGSGSVAGNGDVARIEAPYLQLVMQRLWDLERSEGSNTLHGDTLSRLGGAARIVADHLERAVGTLTTAQQDIAAALFKHLVTPSGTKIAHRVSDLAEYAGIAEDDLFPVVRGLAAHRILRPDETGRYEIYHDVLAAEVLAWRARHDSQRAVERARALSRRRHRRLAAIAFAAFLAAAAMAGVTVFALGQRSDARRQADAARQQKAIAEAQTGKARDANRELHENQQELQRTNTTLNQKNAQLNAQGRRLKRANATLNAQGRRLKATNAALRTTNQRLEQQREKTAQKGRALKRSNAHLKASNALAEIRRRKAQRQARRAHAGELAETAEARLGVDPITSVRLAAQAAQLEPASPRIEDILRRSIVSSHARAILPGDGRSAVRTAAFSPDGSRVAVAYGHGGVRLYRAGDGKLLRTLETKLFVSAAAFSPDGTLLATADGDGKARLWRGVAGKPIRALAHGGPVTSVSFSADGRFLISAGVDRVARVWRVPTGELVATLQLDARVTSASLSPDGTRAVMVSGPPPRQLGPLQASLFDVASGRLIALLPERGITSAMFSPDGALVATTSTDRTARLWDGHTGVLLHTLPQPDGQVLVAAFSPDGKLIVAGGRGGTAYVWDVATGTRLLILVGPTNFVEDVSFSRDGRFVVVASLDRAARIYQADSGLQAVILAGHAEGVTRASFSPDGASVVTASIDGTARIWDSATSDQLLVLGRHQKAVNAARFSPDGRLVVSASADGTARIWAVAKRRQVAVLRSDGRVRSAYFSPDGKLVVTASDDGTARLWSVATGRQLRILRHDGPVADAAFSTDSKLVVTASEDGTARVWTVAGVQLAALRHPGPVTAAAFSPDGSFIATASGRVGRLWNVAAATVAHTLQGHRDDITRIVFSPDGSLLATASDDTTARIWRVSTGRLTHRLIGHKDSVTDVEWSRGGRRLVTSSLDRDARIWDVPTGHLLHVLRGHFSTVQAASFSPDGRWVITAGQFGAGLWDASTGRLFSVSGSATDQFLHGHTLLITSASFARDSRTILTSSLDGTVRIYRCDLCGGTAALLGLARSHLHRLESSLTSYERKRYLG